MTRQLSVESIKERLKGVLCATITPFREDLAVDYGGIAANASWLDEHQIRVLVVNGSIGEAPLLDRQEKAAAVAATVRASDALVIAGCSDTNPTAVVALARDAASAGAAAVMLQPPHHYRLGPDEVVSFFTWLNDELPIPFLLYDNPATSRTELSADVIARISRLRMFIGLKEASPDMVRFFNLMDDFGGRFPVIAAIEDPLLFMLAAGAPACMTASAAFAPQLLLELQSAATSNPDRARQLFGRIHAFRRLFAADHAAGRPTYIAYTKAAVGLVGQAAGPLRPPLRRLDKGQMDALRDVLVHQLHLNLAADAA
jgi:dihydrodipicolinate synthase/N-acetylneuraminate lyase